MVECNTYGLGRTVNGFYQLFVKHIELNVCGRMVLYRNDLLLY